MRATSSPAFSGSTTTVAKKRFGEGLGGGLLGLGTEGSARFRLQDRVDDAGKPVQLGPPHRIFERLRDEHGFTGGYTIQTV